MSAFDLLAPVWTHLTTIQPVRGQGIYLYDAQGRAYMDFTSGIGVTNTGHAHPRVVAAIQAQAERLLFGQINIVVTPAVLELAAALNDITPSALDTFFFSNSGAEAVEAAVKLARQATGRRNIIVFQGSFHGRTAQAMAMTTSKYIYRYNYQPLPAGVFVAPFPYAYFYGWDEARTVDFALQQLDYLLHGQTKPDEVAALVIEPVLGEGGYVPAPFAFLRALRELADRHGMLLVLDEVQTGFGRTGKMFALEHAGVVPDILVMAKGLGSGLPISGIAAPRELMRRWVPGSHGGTYGGGSAVALAAAKATIEVLVEEDLPAHAARMGQRLMQGLREIQRRYPVLGDVRGLGLMVGTEFTHADGRPAKDVALAVQQAALDEGLLLLTCGTYGNVIRWIPPLVVQPAEIDRALAIFERALARATAGT